MSDNDRIQQGYPYPPRWQDDVLMVEDVPDTCTMYLSDYNEMVEKATAFDILCADIKARVDYGYEYPVQDDLVLAVTGLQEYIFRKKHEEQIAKMKAEEAEGDDGNG